MNYKIKTTASRPAWLLPTPARRDEPPAGSSLRALLLRLMRGENLERSEAGQLLGALLDGQATDAQIAAALVALAVKGETVEELAGMAAAMRERSTRITSRHKIFIDTAGSGSSAVKTFNVSTAAAFVIAGAGLPVAKHGSRAATSRSGSADVLTKLGVKVDAPADVSENSLNELGICFMFAPLYHGATARVAGVRRELGVHTTFNLLGPLTNPAGAPRQIIGVWHPDLVEPLAHTLAALGTERAWVVHGRDGLDEITLNGRTFVAETFEGQVRRFEINPEDFGLKSATLENVRDNDAEGSAAIIRSIFSGERRDEARDLVVINAAAALVVGGATQNLKAATRLAEQSIDSGAAQLKLDQLVKNTNA
ncbi:MAG: anthranilate phosphoribosyltransferase [Pyrinomonadaceae bacterium]|jgi:anthranilate phosphoribosyltransferase|nr:anthranilate phosphoribosyltransferase [Pyrinomonadaceae bacterium]